MTRSEPNQAPEPSPGTVASAPERPPSAWVEDHLDAVYRYARRRLKTAEDAEDVTQQTFEALYRALADGRRPRDAGAYLLGTARRRVADVLRRRGRRPPIVTLPDGWESFTETTLPGESLERGELRDLVHVALGLMPAAQRALLLAYYRGGATVAEIATRGGWTEKAAEMRLRRARAAFADRFLRIGRDWLDEEPEAEAKGDSQ